MEKHNSAIGTLEHKAKVNKYMSIIISELLKRAVTHDDSKLSEDEKPFFDEYEPKLKTCTFQSDEYKQYLKELKPALDHHYAKNRHHCEHFTNGIQDMNLIDLIEMLIDWKASSERQQNGNILKSIDLNQDRFGYSNELSKIFKNTISYLDTI